MNEKQLLNAMQIGSFNPLDPRDENDLGRFGLGLKTASFSQCRRLTIRTKSKSGKIFTKCWDLDLVSKEKEWILLRKCADISSENNLKEFSFKSTGTIVLWEKLDRLVEANEVKTDKEHFYRKFENVKKHLGITFHRFIESNKISIFTLGEKVHSINPFHISTDVPSTELQEEQLSINNQKIIIQPFILPHESKLSEDEKKQLQITKGWTEHQGIYLYRNNRLISDGTWLDLDFRKKDSQRLCRISIDIPNTLDKEWQIDVKKSSAKIPDVIRKRIKDISFSAIEKSIRVYTHRGAYIKRRGEKKEIVYLWIAKQKYGKRFYEINKKHPIYQLLSDYLEDDAYIFTDYIKLIGETLPISFIVNDFSDPATIIKDFFEGRKSDLQIIYENTLRALINAGVPEAEAIKKVSQLECFQKLNIK